MEHTVQLGAGSFLNIICPNPGKFRNRHFTRNSTRNGAASVEDVDEASDNKDDEDADAEFDNEGPDDAPYAAEINDGIQFDPGDTLGKLLACITQVCV